MQDVILILFIPFAGSVLGALTVFFVKGSFSHGAEALLSGFSAGVMVAASVFSLLIPAIESSSAYGFLAAIPALVGLFIGFFLLQLTDLVTDRLFQKGENEAGEKRVFLLTLAVTVHNLPEGIAAGIGFGSENTAKALVIAGGIALQNIPEGMVIIAPMIAAGMSGGRTFIIALMTGVVEVIGTLLGYFAVSISTAVLPFALAFAGGTMLYVISDEMIPETHAHGNERGATYSLLLGFCVMLAFDYFMA